MARTASSFASSSRATPSTSRQGRGTSPPSPASRKAVPAPGSRIGSALPYASRSTASDHRTRVTPAGDWNAASYDRVADPQARWGAEVLQRLPLVGDETVLDAGCGTGRVTELLLARLPRGGVVALDASEAMLEQARG